GAHPRCMLAGHQRVVAEIVARCLGGIAGGKDAGYAFDTQIAIDEQAAKIIALAGDLCGERRGADTGRPDDGGAFDVLAGGERYACGIHLHDTGAETALDTKLMQRLLDERPRTRSHIRRDRITAIDDDDADIRIFTE